jgi:hypothetical protein
MIGPNLNIPNPIRVAATSVRPIVFNNLLLSGTWTSPYNRIYSISNTSSTANSTFNAGITTGLSSYVWNFFPYQGKILLGGFFTTYNGSTANYFAEINTNGTLSRTGLGTGFDQSVRAIYVQGDGKIICAGQFTSYNGVGVNRIVRLNSDFTIDGTFNVGTGFDLEVNTLVSDNTHIYLVGSFTTYKGVSRNRFVKIRISDGTDDTGVNSGFTATCFGIAIKNDFIYITGDGWTSYNGTTVSQNICKINKNTLVADSSFTTNLGAGASARTYCYNSITDNHLYVNGNFGSINGFSKPYVGRISLNGAVDSSFPDISPENNVLFGKLINNNTKYAITGSFTFFGGDAGANRFGVYDVSTMTIDTNFTLNLGGIGTTIGEY